MRKALADISLYETTCNKKKNMLKSKGSKKRSGEK